MKSINNYSAVIAKAKEVIEEKKKCLIGVVRIAKELKVTPSVRAYCDLAQVVTFLHCEKDLMNIFKFGLNSSVMRFTTSLTSAL